MISENRILALLMAVMLVASIILTYHRALISKDFEIVNDIVEISPDGE